MNIFGTDSTVVATFDSIKGIVKDEDGVVEHQTPKMIKERSKFIKNMAKAYMAVRKVEGHNVWAINTVKSIDVRMDYAIDMSAEVIQFTPYDESPKYMKIVMAAINGNKLAVTKSVKEGKITADNTMKQVRTSQAGNKSMRSIAAYGEFEMDIDYTKITDEVWGTLKSMESIHKNNVKDIEGMFDMTRLESYVKVAIKDMLKMAAASIGGTNIYRTKVYQSVAAALYEVNKIMEYGDYAVRAQEGTDKAPDWYIKQVEKMEKGLASISTVSGRNGYLHMECQVMKFAKGSNLKDARELAKFHIKQGEVNFKPAYATDGVSITLASIILEAFMKHSNIIQIVTTEHPVKDSAGEVMLDEDGNVVTEIRHQLVVNDEVMEGIIKNVIIDGDGLRIGGVFVDGAPTINADFSIGNDFDVAVDEVGYSVAGDKINMVVGGNAASYADTSYTVEALQNLSNTALRIDSDFMAIVDDLDNIF